jgi:hypothetical protein
MIIHIKNIVKFVRSNFDPHHVPMRKNITLLLVLIMVSSLRLWAQDEKDISDSTCWDFGLYVAPNFDSRMISGNADNGVTSAFLKDIEKYRIGYSIGATVTRQVSRKLYIETGFVFESMGYKTNTLQDTVLIDYPYTTFVRAEEFHQAVRYNAMEIPVVLRVNLFSSNKAQFNFGFGLAPEFFLNKATLSFFNDHTERDITKAERDVELQGLINFNINIPLTKNLSLGIEPAFRYSILGFKDAVNNGIKRNLFSAGLGFKINYKVTDKWFYDYFYLHIYKKPQKTNF